MRGFVEYRANPPLEAWLPMSDILTAMREFRALDDKRRNGGLGGDEEQRWNALRSLLKGDGKVRAAPQPASAESETQPSGPSDSGPMAPMTDALTAEVARTLATAPGAAPIELPAQAPAPVPAEADSPAAAAPAEEAEAESPADEAEPPAEAAPDENGYVWDGTSGLFWNVLAHHGYEPQHGVYYDAQGAVIEPAIAQAALSAALAASRRSAAPEAIELPESVPLDDEGFAALLEPTPEELRLTDDELEPSAPLEPAPESESAAVELAFETDEAFPIEHLEPAADADATPAIDVAVELDGDPDDTLDLASGADLLHLAADAAGAAPQADALPLETEPEAPPAADDPWAAAVDLHAADEAQPQADGWALLLGPVTPGPARPSIDLWASVAAASPARPTKDTPRKLVPELLPFDVSRVPVIGGETAEAEIEAGFDGWNEEHPSVDAGNDAAIQLPWEPVEPAAAIPPRAAETPADEEETIELSDEATPGPLAAEALESAAAAATPVDEGALLEAPQPAAEEIEIAPAPWLDEPEQTQPAAAETVAEDPPPAVEIEPDWLAGDEEPLETADVIEIETTSAGVGEPSDAERAVEAQPEPAEELESTGAGSSAEPAAAQPAAADPREVTATDWFVEPQAVQPAAAEPVPPTPQPAGLVEVDEAEWLPPPAEAQPAEMLEVVEADWLVAEETPAIAAAQLTDEVRADVAIAEAPSASELPLRPAADDEVEDASLLVIESADAPAPSAQAQAWLAAEDDDAAHLPSGPTLGADGRVLPAAAAAAPVSVDPWAAQPPVQIGRLRIERAPAPASDPAPTTRVFGEHRVVIHTRDGVVKRGSVDTVDLAGRAFTLTAAEGTKEEIATASLKAVFLMRGAETQTPEPHGRSVKLTLIDGRPLSGWAADTGNPVGFFLVPADTRGNASRVFVYRAAIKAIAAS